jgi:ribosomal 50S subunit-associated protein YjgA (DUF615 family)
MNEFLDPTEHLAEMNRRKNMKIGKMLIELETVRKFLDTLKHNPLDRHELSERIESIRACVDECSH